MADRQTMNVSLPPAQEQFVRAQVESGRYRSASEVVREGLRLLERTEHRRLLEKWIYDSVTPEEEAQIPEDLKERVRKYFQELIDEGLRSIEEGGLIDGPQAMRQLREELESRHSRRSA